MSLVYIPVGSAYGLNIKPSQTALWYFYEVGTNTPKDTFPTSAETPGTAHTNPVVSDENGVFPLIYTSGLYKAQITDLYGANIHGPWDNLQGRDGDLIDQGIFDSTTNGGDYPASGSKGDQYDVIETFDLNATSGGHSVFDGDRIQANKNGATGIDADWDIILGKNSRQKVVDFSSKNLVFSNLASGSEDVDADSINLVNSNNQVKQITDINDAYVPGDLDVGTMKASHWYHKWIDEDKTLKLSVELTGTSGTASAGFLVWASGTALTDGVKAGDVVYNTAPGERTKTTVSVTPTVDGDPIALTADIFNTGDTFQIHKLSPAGLGNYKADLGAVYSNAAGNFDDSYYTQIQEAKSYNQDTGFIVTTNLTESIVDATCRIFQVNDWAGTGSWRIGWNIYSDVNSASRTGLTWTMAGMIFKTGNLRIPTSHVKGPTGAGPYGMSWAVGGSNTVDYTHAASTTDAYGSATSEPIELDKKPSLHN